MSDSRTRAEDRAAEEEAERREAELEAIEKMAQQGTTQHIRTLAEAIAGERREARTVEPGGPVVRVVCGDTHEAQAAKLAARLKEIERREAQATVAQCPVVRVVCGDTYVCDDVVHVGLGPDGDDAVCSRAVARRILCELTALDAAGALGSEQQN